MLALLDQQRQTCAVGEWLKEVPGLPNRHFECIFFRLRFQTARATPWYTEGGHLCGRERPGRRQRDAERLARWRLEADRLASRRLECPRRRHRAAGHGTPRRVMIGGVHVHGSPALLTLTPGGPDVTKCTVTGEGLRIAKAGMPAKVAATPSPPPFSVI